MLGRAAIVWFGIMLLAILNGAARDILFAPRMGDPGARALSCVTLSALIVAVTWVSLRWIGPVSSGDAWRTGAAWLVMTLAFEFIAGHYLFRTPWPLLLADYNLLAGRLWVLVLVVTLAAPALVFHAGRNPAQLHEFLRATSEHTPRP
jgi:hypothetical protein